MNLMGESHRRFQIPPPQIQTGGTCVSSQTPTPPQPHVKVVGSWGLKKFLYRNLLGHGGFRNSYIGNSYIGIS